MEHQDLGFGVQRWQEKILPRKREKFLWVMKAKALKFQQKEENQLLCREWRIWKDWNFRILSEASWSRRQCKWESVKFKVERDNASQPTQTSPSWSCATQTIILSCKLVYLSQSFKLSTATCFVWPHVNLGSDSFARTSMLTTFIMVNLRVVSQNLRSIGTRGPWWPACIYLSSWWNHEFT